MCNGSFARGKRVDGIVSSSSVVICTIMKLKQIVCKFSGGEPLGITFEWEGGLKVTEVHKPIEVVHEEDIEDNDLKEEETQNGQVTLKEGDVLVEINNSDVSSFNFEEVVGMLKSAERDDRFLKFQRKNDVLNADSVTDSSSNALGTDVPEDDASDGGGDEMIQMNCSPFHTDLLKTLRKSKKINPIHVHVVNLSYWYKMRKTLGGRKHLAVIAQKNLSNMRYESYMFVMKPREEDGTLVPHKKFLLSHSSKLAAWRHSEKCVKERDGNPALHKDYGHLMNPNDILSTHYRVIVVSQAFYGMNYIDRVALVYSELIEALGSSPNRDHEGTPRGSGFCPPSQLKLGSVFGENMCALPMFRAIVTKDPLTLIIEPYTPSQWKPDLYPPPLTERYSGSHTRLSAVEVEPAARRKEQTKRLKVITDTAVYDKYTNANPLAPGVNARDMKFSTSELLGLDSNVLHNTFRKRIGGAYGHFFKDLSPGVKEMVMRQFEMNKQLIQKEGARMKESKLRRGNTNSNIPMTTGTLLRAKADAAKNAASYDVGCSSEAEMFEEYVIHAKRIERLAIRLQRMWRMRYVHFAMRKLWIQPFAAIQIQRRVRGRFARLYVNLLRSLAPVAKKRIVVAYRAWRTRERLKAFFALVKKATEVISPILKRFVKKLYTSWIRTHNRAARTIQCLIRMYIARTKFYKLLGARFVPTVVVPRVVQIQSLLRGVWARRRVESMVSSRLHQWVDIPAAIKIQSLVRGIAGRKIFYRKKLEHYHSIIIQKYVMRLHRVLIYKRLRRVMLERYCATQIQKIYRGRLDRELVQHRRHARWYRFSFIPAIIRTQAVVRKRIAQKFVTALKAANRGALTIQLAHRCYKARIIYNEKLSERKKRFLNQHAACIQKVIRGYLAKQLFKSKLMDAVGKRFVAARVIMKAWVNFCSRRRFDSLMGEQRAKLYRARAKKMSDLRQEIFEDVNEIVTDLDNAAKTYASADKRQQDINEFLVESSIRMSNLEKMMETISMDDIEKGWGEAYGLEYEQLNNQSALGREEARLRKIQMKKTESERVTLTAELEDTELELDSATLMEVDAYEFLRRQEIGTIQERLDRIRNREIRLERCKWKIPSTRVQVIRRNKGYFEGMDKDVKQGRSMQYASTVDYEKRKKRWDEEHINLRRNQRQAYKQLTSEAYKYENYATSIQDAFNDVTANTMSLLRGITLDERVRRMTESTKEEEKTKKKKRGGLTAALKPGNQKTDLSAFSYLDSGATGDR